MIRRKEHPHRDAPAEAHTSRARTRTIAGAGPLLSSFKALLHEDLNFLLTNRVPRRLLTRCAGWYARIESRALARVSIAVWSKFAGDLRLDESEPVQYTSVQQCFTRTLRAGTRPIAHDPDVLVSPCDAIVGAIGHVARGTVWQAKGMSYTLPHLFADDALAMQHTQSSYVTLRLKSNMYHRFHAPCDARIRRVRYISGDTWNVNPIALARVQQLFCHNERAVIEFELDDNQFALTLVTVAAILVASIHLNALPVPLTLQYRGANIFDCHTPVQRGDELGHFENGSTIIAFAGGGFACDASVQEGRTIRMGEPLFRRVDALRSHSQFQSTLMGETHG